MKQSKGYFSKLHNNKASHGDANLRSNKYSQVYKYVDSEQMFQIFTSEMKQAGCD